MNEKIEVPTMKVPPLKKVCMTIGQLPSSYVETMSYYEMLVWFVNYLRDDIIPVVNANGEATHELQELYVELQNYVNNYFDNLDVQEEIDNKIDSMIEDGSFQEIIGNWTTENYVPREIDDAQIESMLSGGKEFLEKSKDIQNITYNTHNYTIRDCKATNKINLSSATHGVIENLHLSNENAGIEINKVSGWSGSNKISKIFSNGCIYPIKIIAPDVTDTSIKDTTIENYRQAITTNNNLYIDNTYIGDNGLTVDENIVEHAIILNQKANVIIENSTIGTTCKTGQNNPVIKFNETTEQYPAYIEIRNSKIGSANQNVSGKGYGGIAELNNKNDRLIIDNCDFFTYPRANANHNVAPFVLKPYKTIWSRNPFYSYICGGNIPSILALSPNNNGTLSVDEEELNLNPFGGNIITYTKYGFKCYYEIPEELIGKTLYLHVYCKSIDNAATPALYYGGSDCSETGYSQNLLKGINGLTTPFVNIYPFTPTKKVGKIRFYANDASGSVTAKVVLCGIFLVEDINKNKVCDYKSYSTKYYSDTIPTESGSYGDIVYSIDPETTDCTGWKYTDSWSAFN